MKHIENLFWLICLAAIGLGLFVPASGLWLKPGIHYFLMAILFFTCLKIDWSRTVSHIREPAFLAYITAMFLLVLPVGIWALGEALVPAFTLGVVILAAMPAGMAGSSLTELAGGNAGLALLGTAASTLLAPITVPLLVWRLGLGGEGGALSDWVRVMLQQSGWLAAILFTPAVLAAVVRRVGPKWVDRHRRRFTGLSIIALGLLILAIVAANSEAAMGFARATPWRAAGLFGFCALFSAVLHLSAFAWAWRRPWRDRVALSINAAYVNNGLAMAFAATFFGATDRAAEAVLPAVAVEVPMILAILPVKWYAGWRQRREAAEGEPPDQKEVGGTRG